MSKQQPKVNTEAPDETLSTQDLEERRRNNFKHAIQRMGSTDDGRLILKELKRDYMDRDSFVPGDPHSTSYREGQRNVVNILLLVMEDDE